MIRLFFIYFFAGLYLISCSSSKNKTYSEGNNIRGPEEIYVDAMILFDNENYVNANNEFLELQKLYPLSNEAIQAEIMSGFISYIQLDYLSAIFKFQNIIQKYPSHKELDYVYYMIAICNYEQINHHELDGKYNEISLDAFNKVILRFPDSKYAKDSRQKIILIKSNKAAKHMSIGRFYLKEKKYTAALNRFKIVVEDYSITKFTPEALYRMVEAYYGMGMLEESTKTTALLGHNYPQSKWCEFSYKLIKKNKTQDSILDKVKNIF